MSVSFGHKKCQPVLDTKMSVTVGKQKNTSWYWTHKCQSLMDTKMLVCVEHKVPVSVVRKNASQC